MAPSLVRSLLVNDPALSTNTITSASFTGTTGNILVVKVLTADSTCVPGTPTGGGWTYTSRTTSTAGSNCYDAIFTATIGASPASQTVDVAFTGGSFPRSMVVEEWSSAQLAVTPAVNLTKTGTGAPSATVITVAANSVVSSCCGDWAAAAPGTPAYRSSALEDNGGAPNGHLNVSGQYTGYYFYQSAGSIGTQTIGLTAPTGQTWAMLGIEIQDAGGAPTAATPAPIIGPGLAAIQASNF